MSAYIEFSDVNKIYRSGEVEVKALQHASFTIDKGEICVIVGPSGAGKTTLLNILGGMDSLTSGKIILDGQEISSFSKRQLVEYRRFDVGFVFQFYNLIQNMTASENVELATEIGKEAFSFCSSLVNVVIPDSVIEIGKEAFRGCASLESVSVPKTAKWRDDTFANCPKLTITRR